MHEAFSLTKLYIKRLCGIRLNALEKSINIMAVTNFSLKFFLNFQSTLQSYKYNSAVEFCFRLQCTKC